EAVSDLVGMMDRVARRYFLPELGKQTLEETLHRDDKLLESATIRDLAKRVTEDLDDLAVLLLFSVFEATVRGNRLRPRPSPALLYRLAGGRRDQAGPDPWRDRRFLVQHRPRPGRSLRPASDDPAPAGHRSHPA